MSVESRDSLEKGPKDQMLRYSRDDDQVGEIPAGRIITVSDSRKLQNEEEIKGRVDLKSTNSFWY